MLARAGLGPVAGIDEAGRGACAGPLVVAAVALDLRGIDAITGLADSKALTAPAREACYEQIVTAALAWSVVVIPAAQIDGVGLHVCNVAGMRRALARLTFRPGYVLTDGFPVRGLAVPALAMWKGDQVAASVAAASVLAKVTRDAIMRELHVDYPVYGFSRHKGYSTPGHMRALADHGPCPEHRRSFANVRFLGQPASESGPLAVAADCEPDGHEPTAMADPVAGSWPGQLAPELLAPAGLRADWPAEATAGAAPGDNGCAVDLIRGHAKPGLAGLADTARGA